MDPLRSYTPLPGPLTPLEGLLEALELEHVQHLLRWALDILYGVKTAAHQLEAHFG